MSDKEGIRISADGLYTPNGYIKSDGKFYMSPQRKLRYAIRLAEWEDNMDLRVIDMNEVRELIYHDEFGEEVIMMSELEPLLMDFNEMVKLREPSVDEEGVLVL